MKIEKQYLILWIDDEHEKLETIKLEAKDHGIIFKCHKSKNAGFADLEKNLYLYDGVLLDAKFFENEDDAKGSEDSINLIEIKDAIIQLPRKIDFFVLTGQSKVYQDKFFEKTFPNYYRKNIDDDIEKLFEDIKSAADQQAQTQIRHKYQKVFNVCTNKYIGTAAAKDLLDILEAIHDTKEIRTELYFNPLRQILEYVFRAANKIGLLHDDCIRDGKVNLTASSLFLSGIPVDVCQVRCTETHFPKIIATNVQNILAITNVASHTAPKEEVDKSKRNLDAYQQATNSPYLLYSLTYQVMDVLLWFRHYADKHPDIDKNKNHWEVNMDVLAIDDYRNYYCDIFLIPKWLLRGIKEGQEVIVRGTQKNTDYRTRKTYPYIATHIEHYRR